MSANTRRGIALRQRSCSRSPTSAARSGKTKRFPPTVAPEDEALVLERWKEYDFE